MKQTQTKPKPKRPKPTQKRPPAPRPAFLAQMIVKHTSSKGSPSCS
jgi:hypothetical protein